MTRLARSIAITFKPVVFAALLALPTSLLVIQGQPIAANAQAASPLPTAPGAERAGEGGLTQAHPSTPSEPGMSPLEPYLIVWLLPASGLLAIFAGIFVDGRMKALNPRRKA